MIDKADEKRTREIAREEIQRWAGERAAALRDPVDDPENDTVKLRRGKVNRSQT